MQIESSRKALFIRPEKSLCEKKLTGSFRALFTIFAEWSHCCPEDEEQSLVISDGELINLL